MKGQCCICTELFQLDSDVSATQCGHTFHSVCLRTWLEQSKTCPQCRNKVNQKYVVDKLFFNAADDGDEDETDVSALKNELGDLRVRVSEQEREKKEAVREKQAVTAKMTELRDSFKTMEQLYRQERSNITTLKREVKFHKELQKEALIAKEETKILRTKLDDLKKVEIIVNGNEADINGIISTGDVKGLSTWCTVLQKELQGKRHECRNLREKCEKLQKEYSSSRRTASEKSIALAAELKRSESLNEQVKDADREVMAYKKKLANLEKALGSPNDSIRTFAHRLLHESPAPMMTPPTKKPKLTDPSEMATSPDMFESPCMSTRDSVEDIGESPSLQRKKHCEEFGTKYVKITSASQVSGKRKAPGVSDISNIHGLGTFNLFKKQTGMGLADSAIRKGYNGLGGHEKFIKPKPFNAFKAPAPMKSKSKFGPSRTVSSAKVPALPTMDGFLTLD